MGPIARLVTRHPVWVLVGAAIFMAFCGVFGGDVAAQLSGGGFSDPAAESSTTARVLQRRFDAGAPNVLLLVETNAGSVDDPAAAEAGRALTEEVAAEPGVTQVASYWSLGNAPPLRGADGTQALVVMRVEGGDEQVSARTAELTERYSRSDDTLTVRVGGNAAVIEELKHVIEDDLLRAELISVPITLLLLVLVFGGVIAATLPLGVGGLAVLGAFGVLQVVVWTTDVSIFAMNVVTMLGLGLAIDYSLFTVSRFREEMRAGRTPSAAATRTVLTAGRTVAFSAATVLISLAALLVFPLYFLRSFAYAGMAVVAVAGLGAVVVLPAILRLLGARVDRWTVRRTRDRPAADSFWYRMANRVMRRPGLVGISVVAILIVLGLPFLGVEFGLPDDRVLPESSATRQVAEEVRANFESNEAGALSVVAASAGDPAELAQETADYAMALSAIDDVSRVDAPTGVYAGGRQIAANPAADRFVSGDSLWLSVVPSVDAFSPEGEAVVHRIRATPAPFSIGVAGQSAELVDSKASLFSRIPLAGLIILVVTFILLFAMFGSLVVPAKAVILNLLSLTAVFGAMVWVFQEGHLSGILGFTSVGTLDVTAPILMFCIAFGLSMDYEVFLLSRIKEEYDRTGDNTEATALGLARTGRIITAAALILAIVFGAFATSGVRFIKLIGLGLMIAVLVDATIIRATLVPAFMKLTGNANWWAPGPLRRLYERYGVSEHVELPEPDRPEPSDAPAPQAATPPPPMGRG